MKDMPFDFPKSAVRFFAIAMDCFVIVILTLFFNGTLAMCVSHFMSPSAFIDQPWLENFIAIVIVSSTIMIGLIYFIIGSSYITSGQTLGKYMLSLQSVDRNLEPLSLSRSMVNNILGLLTFAIPCIPLSNIYLFFMNGNTQLAQDVATGVYCVYKCPRIIDNPLSYALPPTPRHRICIASLIAISGTFLYFLPQSPAIPPKKYQHNSPAVEKMLEHMFDVQ